MFKPREYLGISLEGDFLKIARVKPSKQGLQLVRLDKLKLVEPLKTVTKPVFEEKGSDADVFSEDVFTEEDPDALFGFDGDEDDDSDDP